MSLSSEQKQAVSTWIAAGDNLSTVQKKLRDEFKVSMTYMDVRFLVDDLGLELKNAAPKADASDVSKASPVAQGNTPADEAIDELPPGQAGAEDGLPPEDYPEDEGVPADGAVPGEDTAVANITLEIDRIVRPGTVVSGTVTFTDGVTGNWGLDQYGRLMLDASQKGYKPSQADVRAFQRELQTQLQKQGF